MIKFDLKDRVAIVTGGAQGFGFSITQRFIKSGAKVIIWDIDNKTTEDAVKKINSENCIYQIVDVKNFDQISELQEAMLPLPNTQSKSGKRL